MAVRRDRIGEEGYNSFGSKMVIKEYRNKRDVDVCFPEYDWTFEHAEYKNFKKGGIKCPYEPRTCGVGYLGEGKYKTRENGKNTNEYKIYHSMLQRCYDLKYQEKHTTYKGCKFVTKREAIEKGYLFVEGDSPREFWENMMSGIAIKYE